MKKINMAGSLMLLIIVIISACSEMNDLHDDYLRNGEIMYVGRIDSLKTFGGRERVLIHCWVTDPRVKNLHLFWNQRRDSLIVPVPAHDPTEPVKIMVGDGNGVIAEGDHTFFIYSYNNKEDRSIVFETLISVYGDRYQSSLVNRPVKSIELLSDNSLAIDWGSSISADETGIQIFFVDKNNNPKDSVIASASLVSPIIFDNIDVTKPINYQTIYLPEALAIDTFYTSALEAVKVTIMGNVALNKPTTVSDVLSDSYPGKFAVDGIISSASRWVSSTTGEHWIEVDLQQPYAIRRFQTYNGTGDAANMAIKNFKFQVNVNDEWVTVVDVTDNTNHSYGVAFNEVTTDKVRFFVPDYPDNQVRLFELEVYTIVTLN